MVPAPGSGGTSSPIPARPLPNFRAPLRASPAPLRARHGSHQPARPQALSGTEARARGRRAELVGGSGSLGGDRLSTRLPRLSRLPGSVLPGRALDSRTSRSLPLGRLPAAPLPPLRLQPSLQAQRWPASSLVARGGCPDSRANQRAQVVQGPLRSVEKPRPESLWDTAAPWVLSGQPGSVAAPAEGREAEDDVRVALRPALGSEAVF